MGTDVNDALTKSGHGLYSYAVLSACCLINHASCLDLLSFGVALPLAMCELNIGIAESGLLTSVPLAGCIFGLPWGYYADTRGRRRSLIISTSVGCVLAMLSSFAPNWQTLLVLKFFGGSFSSAGITLTMTYLGECTVEKHRSKYMFILNSANLASDIMLFALAYFIFPLNIDVPIPWLGIRYNSWRTYIFTMAVLLGLGCVMVCFLLESPKFLATVGKTDEALDVLRKMHKINTRSKKEYPVHSLQLMEAEDQTKSFWTSLKEKIVPMFKIPLLWRTLQLFYLFVITYSTINVFYMWFPLFINNLFKSDLTEDKSFCQRIESNSTIQKEGENQACESEMSVNTIYSGIFYGVVLTALNLTLSAFAKWRRLVLIVVLILSATCIISLNVVTQPIVTVGLFTMVMSTGIGIGIVATYFNDMYPTSFRGLATSLGGVTARMASFAAVNIFGVAIVSNCSLLFYCWAVFVISGIAMALFLPADRKAA